MRLTHLEKMIEGDLQRADQQAQLERVLARDLEGSGTRVDSSGEVRHEGTTIEDLDRIATVALHTHKQVRR